MYPLNPFAHFQHNGIVFYREPYIFSPELIVFDSPLLYDAYGNPIRESAPRQVRTSYKPFFPNDQFDGQRELSDAQPRIIIGRFAVPVHFLINLRR